MCSRTGQLTLVNALRLNDPAMVRELEKLGTVSRVVGGPDAKYYIERYGAVEEERDNVNGASLSLSSSSSSWISREVSIFAAVAVVNTLIAAKLLL